MMTEIRSLTCCCCGARTQGRQWFNRDTGFGLCEECAQWIAKKETPEHMRSNYGERGIHYDLNGGPAPATEERP